MEQSDARPKRGRRQNLPAYYLGRINEKGVFLKVLSEICKEVPDAEYVTGRQPFPLRDMVFSLVYKAYDDTSAPRFQYDLKEARDKGFISAAPSPNTLSEYMREQSLTDVLRRLITKSSLPLAGTETVFAVDSTGFSLPQRYPHFDRRSNRLIKKRDYMKLHVIVGVESNVITCAEPSERTAADGPFLKRLVAGTAKYFELTEVSADAAYLSGENMHAIRRAGAMPYIAFKRNSAIDGDYKSTLWKDLCYLYKTRHKRLTEHYYLRNNVESSFKALKDKFGGRLRSRSKTGQFNEALCKALCHNICVLVHSMYASGIDPTAWENVVVREEAAAGPTGAAAERLRKDEEEISIAAAGRPALAKKLEAEREAASFKAAEKEVARMKADEKKKTAEQTRRPEKAKQKGSSQPAPQTQAALF